MEIIPSEQQKNKKGLRKIEERLRNLQDTIRWINICTMGIPEGQEREAERIFEDIMTPNSPNSMKDTKIYTSIKVNKFQVV